MTLRVVKKSNIKVCCSKSSDAAFDKQDDRKDLIGRPGPCTYCKTFFSDRQPNLADDLPKIVRCIFVAAKCSEKMTSCPLSGNPPAGNLLLDVL